MLTFIGSEKHCLEGDLVQFRASNISEQQLSNCENWFDVAACCYVCIQDILCRASITEESFISRYIDDCPETPIPNPNNAIQKDFLNQCRAIVSDEESSKIRFEDAVSSVMSVLSSLDLEPFLDREVHKAVPAWLLILAIDSVYAESDYPRTRARSQPLNTNVSVTGIAAYLIFPISDFPRFFAEEGLRRIPEEKLQNQLAALIFLTTEEKKAPPRVKRIPDSLCSPFQDISLARNDQLISQDGLVSRTLVPKLRIGSCPFSSERLSDFDVACPIEFKRGVGASFIVHYNDSVKQYFDSIICPALCTAIEQECQVLIFPEIVFAPSFHASLVDSLKTISDKKRLTLIVAGSTWDEQRRMNTSSFYDRNGAMLGVSHKRHPFSVGSGDGKLVEDLAVPDEPDTFVDTPGVGRVATAICKDVVSDHTDLYRLVDVFNVQLVCVPAFSRSVKRGFELPLSRLAERNLAVSCMANYCAERNQDEEMELGYVCCPGSKEEKRSAQAIPVFESIWKNECRKKCCEGATASCLDVIDIDYSTGFQTDSFPTISVKKIQF